MQTKCACDLVSDGVSNVCPICLTVSEIFIVEMCTTVTLTFKSDQGQT